MYNWYITLKAPMANTKVIKIPETMTIHFIQSIPFHSKYIPPKVTIIDTKGSIIKKAFNFFGSEVRATNPPSKKKINDMERICVCKMVSISRSPFLNFMTVRSSLSSLPK